MTIKIELKKGEKPEITFNGNWQGSDIMLVKGFLGRSYKIWKNEVRKEEDKDGSRN